MKKVALLLTFVVSIPAVAANTVEQNLVEVEQLDNICRGESGDKPETWKACAKRDKLVEVLKGQGWCHGHDGQAGYERQWESCTTSAKKPEIVALYLPSNGLEGKSYSLDAGVIAFPERKCDQTYLRDYQNMQFALYSRYHACYYKHQGEVIIKSRVVGVQRLPEELFAVAVVDEKTNTAKVIQPGFTSEKAAEKLRARYSAAIKSSMPGGTLPPRQTQ